MPQQAINHILVNIWKKTKIHALRKLLKIVKKVQTRTRASEWLINHVFGIVMKKLAIFSSLRQEHKLAYKPLMTKMFH